MSKVGLVLGGGGVTGAAFHFGTLLTLRMATGWDLDDAEVVVGTSSGGFAAALVRGHALELGTMVGDTRDRAEAAARLRERVYPRNGLAPATVLRWLRRGVLPALPHPDLQVVLGSPGVYRTSGIEAWIREAVGPTADGWPARPTVVVAYDLEDRRRVAFGTEGAPPATLARAVAASTAVPVVYEPVRIGDRLYVDGGVASGTSADLVLGCTEPLDLVLVVAPMAGTPRGGRRFYEFYEDVFDRAGRAALDAELEAVREAWPEADVVVLRPDSRVLDVARPNPMSVEAAIPTFLATVRTMRDQLAEPGTWEVLERHLVDGRRRRRAR